MHKRLKIFFAMLTALAIPVSAQVSPGAKQISLANSDAAYSDDVFAAFNNPAGLAQLNWHEVGLYYSPSPFGLKELSNAYAVYSRPLFFGTAAAGGMSYGFDLYRENRFLVAYAINYLNKFFAGLSFNYHTVSIKNYGFDGAMYLNAGLLAYISDDVRWGFYISNLNRATFGDEKDQIPVIYNSGFCFGIIENLFLCTAVEKETAYPLSVRFGIDYEIIKYLSLRTGWSSEPVKFTAGLGIRYSFFTLDYAFFNHNELGLTHQAGILISFKEEESRSAAIRKFLWNEK